MGSYRDDTLFLTACPNFLLGLATAFDIGGTLVEYNVSISPQEADFRAIASDWAIVGQDIFAAINDFVKEEE